MRIKFQEGKQRKFIEKVIVNIGSPSLRELSRRLDINYSTMKNYYYGLRLMPQEFFENLVKISGGKENVILLKDHWGQVKGGKKSKR
jgi:hypothetical protein